MITYSDRNRNKSKENNPSIYLPCDLNSIREFGNPVSHDMIGKRNANHGSNSNEKKIPSSYSIQYLLGSSSKHFSNPDFVYGKNASLEGDNNTIHLIVLDINTSLPIKDEVEFKGFVMVEKFTLTSKLFEKTKLRGL
jgi:hypothetical protein